MKNATLSIIRHVLTAAGGFIIAKGWISESALPEIIGAILAIVGALWGAADEKIAEDKSKDVSV